MSSDFSWQHLSVTEFYQQSNWSGKSQELRDKAINTADIFTEVSWLCQKIENFFSHSNWQGELLSEISSPDFSLTLPVEGFFQLFAWESNSIITPLPKLEPIPKLNQPPDDELSLDNFGNLF